MPRKVFHSYNPFLNEYLYTILNNVTREQKKTLSKATLRILSSSARARNFCIFSSDDEKKRVLCELGSEWATVIMPRGIKSVNELKQMMIKVEEGRTAAGLEHLTKEKIFITTDKQTCFLLGLAGQTISHKNYFLNLDLLKIGHSLKRWQKSLSGSLNDEVLEAEEDANLIDGVINSVLNNAEISEGLLGISMNELKILIYLNKNKHLYIDFDRLKEYFSGSIKGTGITYCLRHLFYSNYVRKHINTRPDKYTITGSGISLVATFRNRVLSQI